MESWLELTRFRGHPQTLTAGRLYQRLDTKASGRGEHRLPISPFAEGGGTGTWTLGLGTGSIEIVGPGS